MRKLLKHKKALSPVVAAIILIAVTVAVSIAVAAWMGALTIGFMGGTEELRITSVSFSGSDVTIVVMNVGTGKFVVSDVKVDGQSCTGIGFSGGFASATDGTLDKGSTGTIDATSPVTINPGVKYTISVITTRGNQFDYTKTAPS